MDKGRYLVCDIGGTNIRIAMFEGDPRHRTAEANYRENAKTGRAWEVVAALEDYRSRMAGELRGACFGIAGRVRDDGAWVALTNRANVTVRREEVAKVLELDPSHVRLVNDMPPHIACVDHLQPSERVTIKGGSADAGGTRAIVMPGSGLGVGGAVCCDGTYRPFPSEGGHLGFAPRDEEQDRLLASARRLARLEGLDVVSNEYLVSGPGLRRIHACLINPDAPSLNDVPESETIAALAGRDDIPADEPRRRTVLMFTRLLGQVCGNVALIELATGGLWVGGSICLQFRDELQTDTFREPFLSSGPPAHRSLLEEIPITLIDYKESGLLGAGVLAMQMG
ncbi:MAG TPA: glucokinase [Tepidisphaeraceae bacterium]|nr:glucokinase [Tepidisphaeraceae bacterium]